MTGANTKLRPRFEILAYGAKIPAIVEPWGDYGYRVLWCNNRSPGYFNANSVEQLISNELWTIVDGWARMAREVRIGSVFKKRDEIVVIGKTDKGFVVRNKMDFKCKDTWVVPYDVFDKTYDFSHYDTYVEFE